MFLIKLTTFDFLIPLRVTLHRNGQNEIFSGNTPNTEFHRDFFSTIGDEECELKLKLPSCKQSIIENDKSICT
jgi:hypothetical protein